MSSPGSMIRRASRNDSIDVGSEHSASTCWLTASFWQVPPLRTRTAWAFANSSSSFSCGDFGAIHAALSAMNGSQNPDSSCEPIGSMFSMVASTASRNFDPRLRREVHFAQEISEPDDERERRGHEEDADDPAEVRVQHRLEEERADDHAERK